MALKEIEGRRGVNGGWGPERETFTSEKPAPYVAFNSITNHPTLGDERKFVRVAKAENGSIFADKLKVSIGDQITVYIWIHNNAAANLNESGKGVSTGTRLSCVFPDTITPDVYKSVAVTISSDNATPQKIWDSAAIYSDDTIKLRYVDGSAKINQIGDAVNGKAVDPKLLFSEEGTLIGNESFNGFLPGCDEYAGNITFQLNVLSAE